VTAALGWGTSLVGGGGGGARVPTAPALSALASPAPPAAASAPADPPPADDDGNIRTGRDGKPITNLTYDHQEPMVARYNGHGYDQTRAERNNDFNDTSNLVPMSRSDNSSKSGGVDGENKPQTYRQDQGENFTWD
jgi:hypothetical protein